MIHFLQNKFDPNWSEQEKQAYYQRKQKTTFKVKFLNVARTSLLIVFTKSEIVLQQLALLRQAKTPDQDQTDLNIPFFVSIFVLLGLVITFINLSENKVSFSIPFFLP